MVKVLCAEDTIIPPHCHRQVRVSWKNRNEVDHFVTPIVSTHTITETFGLAAKCVLAHDGNSINYSKFGSQPISLGKDQRIANAVPLKFDDCRKDTNEFMHLLTSQEIVEPHFSALGDEMCCLPDTIPKFNGYEQIAVVPDSQDRSPEPHRVKPTYKVFDVALNDQNVPRPEICRVIDENIEAFSLDGRPGRVNNGPEI